MYLKKKIDDLFAEFSGRLHIGSDQMPREQVEGEFKSLRSYFLTLDPSRERVAFRLPHDHRFFLGIYAAMSSGVTYIPTRPDWPETRIKQIQDLTGFTRIIDEASYREIVGGQWGPDRRTVNVGPETPLYIICTSGSTGLPKAVCIPRRAYQNYVQWMDSYFSEFGSDQTILLTTDFTFDVSLLDMALFMLRAPRLYFSKFASDFFALAAEIEEYKITCLNTVPNNASMLLSDEIFGRADLSSLQYLMLGGSRFSYSAYRNIRDKMNPRPITNNVYGPTEATVYCHVKRITWNENDDCVDHNVSIGKPIAGMSCVIVDQGRAVTEPRKTGELMVAGPQLMKEYVGNPKKTSEALTTFEGSVYYKTGDLSFFDEKGDFYVVGRVDDTLKHKGFRVNLLDIDAYVQKLDGVQDAVTVAIPDEKFDNLLVTYVIPSHPDLNKTKLREAMAAVLVDYQMPDEIELISQFPTSTAGKVSKKALAEIYLNSKK